MLLLVLGRGLVAIPGSRHIPLGELGERMGELPADKPVAFLGGLSTNHSRRPRLRELLDRRRVRWSCGGRRSEAPDRRVPALGALLRSSYRAHPGNPQSRRPCVRSRPARRRDGRKDSRPPGDGPRRRHCPCVLWRACRYVSTASTRPLSLRWGDAGSPSESLRTRRQGLPEVHALRATSGRSTRWRGTPSLHLRRRSWRLARG